MSKKVYEESNIAAIATAIRKKTGEDKTYKTSEMPEGVNEVYEAGKKSEHDAFWDGFQQNGTRTNYQYAFGGTGWGKDKTFKPKYDIIPTSVGHMFREHGDSLNIYDLAARLEGLGIKLDLSNVTGSVTYMFYNAYINRLPELDLRNVPSLESLIRSSRVVTIDKIILNNEGDQLFSIAFQSCSNLTNIEFDGVIGRDISFSVSPLSVKSTKSIITHLKNYAGTDSEYAYTVTFKASAFKTLEAEGATSPNGNTWAEYIDDLKWNLVKA